MTMPKKGARRIVVDGEDYRWRLRQKPDGSDGVDWWIRLVLSVEPLDNSRAILVADLGRVRLDPCLLWLPCDSGVTPSEVAHGVRTAIQAGWKPAIFDKPFHQPIDRAPAQLTVSKANSNIAGHF